MEIERVLRLHPARFIEWLTYMNLDPVGETRQDWRVADLMALIANVHRDPKKRAKPFSPTDFLRQYDAAASGPRRKTWQEIKRSMRGHLDEHVARAKKKQQKKTR